VTRISDGDTIHAIRYDTNATIKIRLHGLDAPELRQTYGPEATAALRAILKRHSEVDKQLLFVEDHGTDKYGRTLGKLLFYDAQSSRQVADVQEEMLRGGHAWHYLQRDKTPLYTEAEGEARSARRGLWSGSSETPLEPWLWRQQNRAMAQRFASRARSIGVELQSTPPNPEDWDDGEPSVGLCGWMCIAP
jgi:endonuclease YncB( thermonuclease family)